LKLRSGYSAAWPCGGTPRATALWFPKGGPDDATPGRPFFSYNLCKNNLVSVNAVSLFGILPTSAARIVMLTPDNDGRVEVKE